MNEDHLKETLKRHETRINDHSKRIDVLERDGAANNVKIGNLCDKLEAQTKSINWLIGIFVSGLLGFFLYAAQRGLINL